jgi:transcriptional regulator with XRE-family HTH domain
MSSETPPAAGETIGQRLKRLRLEGGLSQRELAAPGVSYAYISRIEAGTRQPSVKALRKLAAKLGVSADYLETGSELDPVMARELRLSDLELRVRLGERDDIESPLRALVVEADAAADSDAAFRGRVALAAIAEERGDLSAAIELLESAVSTEPFEPVGRIDVYTQLGRLYAFDGHHQQSIELFERCFSAADDVPSAAARYAVLLSYALMDIGEVARAEDVVRSTLERMGDTEDPYMRVRLYWSMARLAETEGRSSVALANIRKAIALLESTEDALNLARAHVLACRLLLERNDSEKAATHLDRAERLHGATPSKFDLVELKILRSRIARLQGDGEGAVALAREALAIEAKPVDRGQALAALADGLVLLGDLEPADAGYREAVDILEAEGRWVAASNTCRSWGRMLRDRGQEQSAMDALDRAAELAVHATSQQTHAER